MEVIKWNKNKKEQRGAGFMVAIDPKEAVKIIQSLSTQIANKNPNSGRIEFYTNKGEYFSISVSDPNIPPPSELEVGFIYDQIRESEKGKAPWRNR